MIKSSCQIHCKQRYNCITSLGRIVMGKKKSQRFLLWTPKNLLQSLSYILGLPAFARVFLHGSSQLLVCEVFQGELEEVPQSHFQMTCSLVSVHPNKQIGR